VLINDFTRDVANAATTGIGRVDIVGDSKVGELGAVNELHLTVAAKGSSVKAMERGGCT